MVMFFTKILGSTTTRDGHNVSDVIVTGFLSIVTTMSRVVTGNCHGFCWYRHGISQLETSFTRMSIVDKDVDVIAT